MTDDDDNETLKAKFDRLEGVLGIRYVRLNIDGNSKQSVRYC